MKFKSKNQILSAALATVVCLAFSGCAKPIVPPDSPTAATNGTRPATSVKNDNPQPVPTKTGNEEVNECLKAMITPNSKLDDDAEFSGTLGAAVFWCKTTPEAALAILTQDN